HHHRAARAPALDVAPLAPPGGDVGQHVVVGAPAVARGHLTTAASTPRKTPSSASRESDRSRSHAEVCAAVAGSGTHTATENTAAVSVSSVTETPGSGRLPMRPGATWTSSLNTSRTRAGSAFSGTVTRTCARLTESTRVWLVTRLLASSSYGISTRRLSAVRSRVYVSPMSSTWPSASPTCTRSPSRTGWLMAIITPATKFA